MNENYSQSSTDRAVQAAFPLAVGLSVAALILAIADRDVAAIALYSLWLPGLTILVVLRVWILRFVRKLSDDAGQPGRGLLSVNVPPTNGRWSVGTVGLILFAAAYALGAFSDLVLEGEPFQRKHVGQLAMVAGFFAILFGQPRPFGPLRGHRVVLAENGMHLTTLGLVEIFQPWENLVDFYWRNRGNGWILFFHARRHPGGPTWPVPQLASIELGRIDDDTRQQINVVLRERICPQTPEPTSPAPSHSSGT